MRGEDMVRFGADARGEQAREALEQQARAASRTRARAISPAIRMLRELTRRRLRNPSDQPLVTFLSAWLKSKREA